MIASIAFSSRELPSARQYDGFREAVNATHFAWDMTPRAGGFRGTIRGRSVGAAALVACACDPCRGRRGRWEVARTDRASFGVLCVLSGRERIAQPGAEVDLQAGSFALWDATQPLAFAVPDALEKLTLLVPEDVLLAAIPDARSHLGVAHDATAGCGALFVSHLRALAAAGELPSGVQELALRAAFELLGGTLGAAAIEARSGGGRALLAEVVRLARARLADPGLDADSLADALGVSRRQLDRTFAATGQSITRWIWRERVLRCRRDLVLEPRTSLAEISARWGFRDAAHFTRLFRREFSSSPREHRARALAGEAGGPNRSSGTSGADKPARP